ncbi:hypothetical protein M6D81_20205 [Paenibacillus sp. J5C_2022]|uniref:hypothetical protein n=1 Tax=Paenibacillus sp. J5C2022 TaxID=2977129 RepID=UPI0021D353DC|nr:hypothetical protein [Paenibacillus sp. J5C2022]MCU6711023.1 hypothetical protein [Paenibacillus sp. J5C2022]
MFRGVAWLGKIVAAGLLISFLSIWTTGYIVTSYVETVLKQYNIPVDVPPMAMSGVWGRMWGSEPLLTAQAVETEESEEERADDAASASDEQRDELADAPLTDIGLGSGSHAEGGRDADSSAVLEEEPPAAEEGLEDAVQESSTEGSESDGVGSLDLEGTETALTTEELENVKNAISEEDKFRLFEILSTKLPQETWQIISNYVEEGLSEEELLSIQQLMAQHLDKEEYDEMMEILKKY